MHICVRDLIEREKCQLNLYILVNTPLNHYDSEAEATRLYIIPQAKHVALNQLILDQLALSLGNIYKQRSLALETDSC